MHLGFALRLISNSERSLHANTYGSASRAADRTPHRSRRLAAALFGSRSVLCVSRLAAQSYAAALLLIHVNECAACSNSRSKSYASARTRWDRSIPFGMRADTRLFATAPTNSSSSPTQFSSMLRKVNLKNRLRVRRVVDVPLREVSGICLRRGRNRRMSLIAVGDHAAKVAWFSLSRSDEGRICWHTRNIDHLLAGGVTSLPTTPGGSTAKPPVLCAIPAAAHPK